MAMVHPQHNMITVLYRMYQNALKTAMSEMIGCKCTGEHHAWNTPRLSKHKIFNISTSKNVKTWCILRVLVINDFP